MGNWVGIDKEGKLTMVAGLVDNDSTPMYSRSATTRRPIGHVQAWLNGCDITENIVRKGDTCTYTQKRPIQQTWNQPGYLESKPLPKLRDLYGVEGIP